MFDASDIVTDDLRLNHAGDINLDGVVDIGDLNEWNAHKFTVSSRWCAGNLPADGVIDLSDFNQWNTHTFLSSSTTRAVPEPTKAGCLAAAWLLLQCVPRRGVFRN